eukprot:gene31266-39284_t
MPFRVSALGPLPPLLLIALHALLFAHHAEVVLCADSDGVTLKSDVTSEPTASPSEYPTESPTTSPTIPPTFSLTRSTVSAGVFFSTYLEGSGSSNKVLQLFNPTCQDLTLAAYVLHRTQNGGTVVDLALSGTLRAGQQFTICETNYAATTCDLFTDFLVHNGDDAYGLYTGGAYVDVFGELGVDPGTGWEVAGVSSATKDHTLVRKAQVNIGNTDWSTSAGTSDSDSEWEVYESDEFGLLDCHTAADACNASKACA